MANKTNNQLKAINTKNENKTSKIRLALICQRGAISRFNSIKGACITDVNFTEPAKIS